MLVFAGGVAIVTGHWSNVAWGGKGQWCLSGETATTSLRAPAPGRGSPKPRGCLSAEAAGGGDGRLNLNATVTVTVDSGYLSHT